MSVPAIDRASAPDYAQSSPGHGANDQLEPTVFVIFGGAGDLTWRKLVPALFDLSQDRSMPADFAVIAVDRVETSDEKLRRRLHDGVNQFSRFGKAKAATWNRFAQHIHYQRAISRNSRLTRLLVNTYRIRKFKLDRFVDAFVSSCFVHLRKPDADMFRLALDIAQAPVRQVLYIENTPMFVQIAEGLGIRSILHTDYRSTCAKLASLGLRND